MQVRRWRCVGLDDEARAWQSRGADSVTVIGVLFAYGCCLQLTESPTHHLVILGEGRESIGDTAVGLGSESPAFAKDDVAGTVFLVGRVPSRTRPPGNSEVGQVCAVVIRNRGYGLLLTARQTPRPDSPHPGYCPPSVPALPNWPLEDAAQ